MKIILNDEQTKNSELYYKEGFWTGKRTIKYNNIPLKKIKRGIYEYKEGETIEQFEIKGNQLIGITIKMFGQNIELLRKLKWYEIILALIVLLPCFLFGAVGGAIGGALGFTNLIIIRQIDKIWLKIVISIEIAIIGLLLSYILAYLVLKTFTIIGLL